jgi:hypothetical protein
MSTTSDDTDIALQTEKLDLRSHDVAGEWRPCA